MQFYKPHQANPLISMPQQFYEEPQGHDLLSDSQDIIKMLTSSLLQQEYLPRIYGHYCQGILTS